MNLKLLRRLTPEFEEEFIIGRGFQKGEHGGKMKATELSAVSKEQKEFPAEIISYHKEIKVENVEF